MQNCFRTFCVLLDLKLVKLGLQLTFLLLYFEQFSFNQLIDLVLQL